MGTDWQQIHSIDQYCFNFGTYTSTYNIISLVELMRVQGFGWAIFMRYILFNVNSAWIGRCSMLNWDAWWQQRHKYVRYSGLDVSRDTQWIEQYIRIENWEQQRHIKFWICINIYRYIYFIWFIVSFYWHVSIFWAFGYGLQSPSFLRIFVHSRVVPNFTFGIHNSTNIANIDFIGHSTIRATR